jgi:hypothetical protein
MSLATFNSTPYDQNLLSLTNNLIAQPNIAPDLNTKGNIYVPSEEDIFQFGSGKIKKKEIKSKKVKEIDTYLKPQLEKIAKKNNVNLKNRDGTIKNKQQLFNSLKRKKLI